MFQNFTIDSLSFHTLIIAPAFSDMAPDALGYSGALNEFTVMDNVVSSRPIVDIRGTQNIMKRRDASCDIIYKKIVGASTRKITTEEVYGATQFCRNEFYQGCLKDFRKKDPLFGQKILPYFQKAMNTDLMTNSYWGDVNRLVAVNAAYSTNIYDGVWKWIKRYTTGGLIPAAQTIAIADATDYKGNPAAAYALLKSIVNKQTMMMGTFMKSEKVIYATSDIVDGYRAYLVATSSTAGNITLIQNGIEKVSIDGIEIKEQPLWGPVLFELKGAIASAAVLTIRGNFIFGTDKSYGEGEDGTTALEVWYDIEKMTWFYRMFLKAGTQIALPEHIVYAISGGINL